MSKILKKKISHDDFCKAIFAVVVAFVENWNLWNLSTKIFQFQKKMHSESQMCAAQKLYKKLEM